MNSSSMIVIDTATEACSVALVSGEKIFSRSANSPKCHTAMLLDMIDEVLAESGTDKSAIGLVACGRGPGSFTGVRIGVGAAQALAFGLGTAALGISDIRICAQGIARDLAPGSLIAVAMDARMNEVYAGVCEVGDDGIVCLITEETVCSASDAVEMFRVQMQKKNISSIYGVGAGFGEYEELRNAACDFVNLSDKCTWLPDAKNAAVIAVAESLGAADPEMLEPVYLRDNVAEKKKA